MSERHIIDDRDTLTTSQVEQLKKIIKDYEANQKNIAELIDLAESVKAAKRMWIIILGLVSTLVGMISWIGLDELVAILQKLTKK